MKRKIKITDNITGKVEEHEYTVRNLDHFEVQRKTRANIFKNKKLYTRKRKHKNRD